MSGTFALLVVPYNDYKSLNWITTQSLLGQIFCANVWQTSAVATPEWEQPKEEEEDSLY